MRVKQARNLSLPMIIGDKFSDQLHCAVSCDSGIIGI
jgi:hypothetical protein